MFGGAIYIHLSQDFVRGYGYLPGLRGWGCELPSRAHGSEISPSPNFKTAIHKSLWPSHITYLPNPNRVWSMQWTDIEMREKYDLESLGPMASKNCRCLARVSENGTDATGLYSVCVKYVLDVPGSQDLVVFLTIKPPVLVLVSRFAAFADPPGFQGSCTLIRVRPWGQGWLATCIYTKIFLWDFLALRSQFLTLTLCSFFFYCFDSSTLDREQQYGLCNGVPRYYAKLW